MENETRGGAGKERAVNRIERALYLSFTLLTVARRFLLHCVECWLYVQEVGSLFPFFLPVGVEQSVERKVCGSGREGQHMLCLQVTRKELAVQTFWT